MPNHPNRKRPAVARRAALLGYELTRDLGWHQADDGQFLVRWRLRKEGSERALDTELFYFSTLADVNRALDIEEARRA